MRVRGAPMIATEPARLNGVVWLMAGHPPPNEPRRVVHWSDAAGPSGR